MTREININDSSDWSELDWDDTSPEALKRTDTQVNRSRSAYFKKGNKEFAETMRNVAINRDEEYKRNHKIGVTEHRDNSYQKVSNSKVEVQAKISKTMSGKKKSEEHKTKLKAVKTNKPGDKNWEQACQEGRNKRDRPFKCPFGVFHNRSEAARFAKENNLFTNAQRKLEGWTKEKPTEYYFITHEEYDKIKNQHQ